MEHFALVDNTAAKQIANKKGVGKIQHLAGKVLWIQEYTASGRIKVIQIPTDLNLADVGTKPLSVARTKALLYCIGMVRGDDGSAVGEAEFEETQRKHEVGKKIKSMAKTLGTMMAIGSLEGANGQEIVLEEKCYEHENVNVLEGDMVNTSWWSLSMTWALACICMVLAISAVMWVGFVAWKALQEIQAEDDGTGRTYGGSRRNGERKQRFVPSTYEKDEYLGLQNGCLVGRTRDDQRIHE